MADRVVPIKVESSTLGGTENDGPYYVPAEVNEDALEAAGYYVQTDTGTLTRDSSCGFKRTLNNLTLFDSIAGAWNLVDLIPPATAADLANVPAGNLSATNVQSALNELQSDIDILNTGIVNVQGFVAASGGVTLNHVVRISATDAITAARANSLANAGACGFASNTAAAGAAVNIITNGLITPVKAVAGQTWNPGDRIYLSSSTAGMVTKVAPTGVNAVVLRVGYAKSNTQMLISIGEPITLGA